MELPVKSDFTYITQLRVRTFEVDSQGIVHNAVYLQYFEIGRVEYRRQFGYNINEKGIFNDGIKVVVVNNTLNYRSPAYLDDLLNVYTRVKWIKNSSFCFEHIIENAGNNVVLCDGTGILVNLNDKNLPEPLADKFVNEINSFEKKLEIIRN